MTFWCSITVLWTDGNAAERRAVPNYNHH